MIRPVSTAALIACLTVGAAAQSVDRGGPERPGSERAGSERYRMAPADGGGFARLDNETGAMSICQRRDGEWACRDMEDDGRRLRQENDRLASENQQLKSELKRLEDFVVGDAGKGGARPVERPGEFKLPSEEDVDKALGYFDRMLKKFRDKFKELEGGRDSTPL